MTAFDTEVAIIGAGPAGSSLAGFLQQRGHATCVFERDVFPRFHIGESLLTMCIPHLLELGLDLAGEPYALRKPGALFWHEPSGENLRIDFAHALEGSFPYAYQVERQHFDHALARRAEALGAEVNYGREVEAWSESAAGVELTGAWGTCRARFMIDASGQQALFGRRRRTIEPLERFGRCASFTTLAHVRSDRAREWVGGGDIAIVLVPHGWMWLIPLTGERVSVGLVERAPEAGTTAQGVLGACLEGSTVLREFFVGAERIAPFRRIANYSYYNLEPNTARCGTVGDASAFLDPIFSSGVTIAIATANLLAREISQALHADRELELTDYKQTCARAYTTFDRLIERFYRPAWVRNVFFASDRDDRLMRELTSILAGDVWRNDNSMQTMLLNSRPRMARNT